MPCNITRRTFLRAGGLAGGGIAAARLLAACSAPGADVGPASPPAVASPVLRSDGTTLPSKPEPTAAERPIARFPDGFLWGAATSAYQIEGAAREDGRGESIWDRFSHTPGRTRNGDTGDVAADHYHRYEQDLDLMRELGIQSYRFSIAWPRILPSGTGTVNQKGLDFYRRLVEGLLKRDIRPLPTLFHWDLPQALQDTGGWESRDTAQRFAEYADIVFRALGDTVPAWLTLNEPKTVMFVGYIYGVHAPGITSPQRAYQALHHMLLGHGLATQAFRALSLKQGQQIGIALNLSPVYPTGDAKADSDAVQLQDGYENRLFLDPVLRGVYPDDILEAVKAYDFTRAIQPDDLKLIGQPIDLLGVNYYNPTYVRADGNVVSGSQPHSEASWQEVYPQGMYDTLMRLKRDYGDIPISIAENGAPYKDALTPDGQVNDPQRLKFLHEHFAATQRAIAGGANVRSYHVWSLMDNFEWAEGYSQRWGIVYVDFKTQRRYPKRSALWYRDVIRQNGIGELPANL